MNFEKRNLFESDIKINSEKINRKIENCSFLILGGAGTIGTAVVKEVFLRKPSRLHVIDLSENNLVELTRDIRSQYGFISVDFKTFALNIDSLEFERYFLQEEKFDFILNFTAIKHVRNEKDQFTLMRMIYTNVILVNKIINLAIKKGVNNFYSVSTDKVVNPVNLMGVTKNLMESVMLNSSNSICVTSSRFANVAYSDGSLLYSFSQRLNKRQPLVAPSDIKRYFVSKKEAGCLCLLSFTIGNNKDIFFPNCKLNLINLKDIAIDFLKSRKLNPLLCNSEKEARDYFKKNPNDNINWPCFFSKSDTTGEKSHEEFFSNEDNIDLNRLNSVGVLNMNNSKINIDNLINELKKYRKKEKWVKTEIVEILSDFVKFNHFEKNKYLDSKM